METDREADVSPGWPRLSVRKFGELLHQQLPRCRGRDIEIAAEEPGEVRQIGKARAEGDLGQREPAILHQIPRYLESSAVHGVTESRRFGAQVALQLTRRTVQDAGGVIEAPGFE